MPDPTPSEDAYDQAPGRLHRPGRRTPVVALDVDPADVHPLLAGRKSAIDIITAEQGEPPATSALDALLADTTPNVTEVDRDELAELHRWQKERARHKASYDALGKTVATRTAEMLARRIERGWDILPATVSYLGDKLQPFISGTLYPKFRVDPETGDKYGRPDVVPALREAGLDHLIRQDYDATAFAAHVRKAVESWQAQAGETGVTNDDGALVDAYGYVLTEVEQEDPTADVLALHPAIREFVEPVLTESIGFGKG